MTQTVLRAVIMGVAAILSACFSGAETALFSLPPDQVRKMAKAGGTAGLAAHLLERPRRLLTTVLFGNMVVNVVFYSVSFFLLAQYADRLGRPATAALGLGVLVVVIIFGEILPKNIAVSFAVPLSRLVSAPLLVFQKVAWPVIRLLEGVTKVFAGFFGRYLHPEPLIRADELAMLIDLSAREGVMDQDLGDMIGEVVQLSRTAVREVMAPRVDMVCFDVNGTSEELEALFAEKRHSVIPVYDGQVDNILGVVHAKDLLLREGGDLRQLLRPVLILPETTTVEDAFERLRGRQSRMCVLVDEYGGIVGLVTIKDMLEEIVGEIGDEHDPRQPPQIEQIGPSRFRVRGDTGLKELAQFCNVELPEVSVDTVGGLVMTLLDRVPKTGDRAQCGQLNLTVERTRHHRVILVLVEQTDEDREGQDDD